MKRFFYALIILIPVIIFSCQKELSLETGRLPGDTTSTTPPTTNTCKLAKVVEADRATDLADYAYISSFNTAHQVVNLDFVDSVNYTIDKSFSLTYPAGKIQVDPSQYFVVGSDGKITEFHGYELPVEGSGQKFTVKYTYNTSGQMVLRTETYDTLPGIVLYQMKFTYSGNNLAKEEIEARISATSFLKLAEILYTYDGSKTVKNFLYLQGLTPEISAFQTAIDAGTNNTNPVTKTVVNFINPTTNTVDSSLTSNFVNYVIDSKNYVQSFDVTGDDFYLAALYATRRYKLSYSCY